MGVPALDDAGVALALADAGDIHFVAFGEDVGKHSVAYVIRRNIVQPELFQVFLHADAGFLQVAGFRLAQLFLGDIRKTQLNGIKAFFVRSFLLHNGAGAGLDDGDRDHLACLVKDLRHADLLADNGLFHVFSSLIKVIG